MWSLLVRQPQGDGAAAQHHQRRCSLGGVETESATSDEANGRVSSLHAAVAESQADGGEDPVAVFADGAAQLDEHREAGALRPAAPAVQQPGDLGGRKVAGLLDRWCGWAQRSRLPVFVKLGRTIREHRDGILAAIRLGLSNGRVEGRNATIRLITRRAFGFHTAKAAAALVMLCCGPITLRLPHEK